MDGGLVPIVPGAVIFDLPVGAWQCRPTAEFGYAAAAGAHGVTVGSVGAGTGARAGVLKGGVGTASVTLESGVTVGAMVVVNAAGNASTPAPACHGWPTSSRSSASAPPADQIAAYADVETELSPLNTTIAVVATDAALSPAGCRRVAMAAHDGLARTIRPCHTPMDGDTVFALATGAVEVAPATDDTGVDVARNRPDDRRGRRRRGLLARAVLVGVLAAE